MKVVIICIVVMAYLLADSTTGQETFNIQCGVEDFKQEVLTRIDNMEEKLEEKLDELKEEMVTRMDIVEEKIDDLKQMLEQVIGYKGVVSHLITHCTTSHLQDGFECEEAFDGDLATYQTPGYIAGWAYGADIPAWVVFYLASPVTLNTVIFKTGFLRGDHHLNDFSIAVLIGETFKAVTGTKVNTEGATIQGSRVTIGGQVEVRVAFDKKMSVTAVKIHAYGSDAPNENSVVNEIFLLNLENVNMNWGEDVDVILNKI